MDTIREATDQFQRKLDALVLLILEETLTKAGEAVAAAFKRSGIIPPKRGSAYPQLNIYGGGIKPGGVITDLKTGRQQTVTSASKEQGKLKVQRVTLSPRSKRTQDPWLVGALWLHRDTGERWTIQHIDALKVTMRHKLTGMQRTYWRKYINKRFRQP